MNKKIGLVLTISGLVSTLTGNILKNLNLPFSYLNILVYGGTLFIVLGAFLTYIANKTFIKEFSINDWNKINDSEYQIIIPYKTHKKKNPIYIISYKTENGYQDCDVDIDTKENDIKMSAFPKFEGRIIIK